MKMGSFFYQENNHGIMGNDEQHGGGSNSSSSSDLSSGSGSDSDLFEEVNSSSSSSLSSSASSSPPTRSKDALHDMSSLLQELPIKRGLSKHYNGRSQSFTSLSNVRSLEDLAKPEHPYNKKLKTCKSYQAFYENNSNNHGYSNEDDHLQTAVPTRRRSCNTTSTKLIKKSSSSSTRGGGSCSSLCTKRNGSFNIGINRPPLIPPLPPLHKSDSSRNTCFNSQGPLFALGV